MPTGPPGWIHRMHQEHGCEFVLAAQGLVPAEVGSGAWLGPTLPGHVEGVAPFCLHLSLLLPLGGGFEGWRVGGGGVVRWRGMVAFAVGWWRGGGWLGVLWLEGGGGRGVRVCAPRG